MTGHEMRIICDSRGLRHPKRRPEPIVTVFVSIGEGRWTERNATPHRQRTLGARKGVPNSGTTLIDDERYSAARDGFAPKGNVRSVYEFQCEYCEKPYQLTEPKLFTALELARHQERVVLTLAELSAIVQHMAVQTPDMRE